MRSFAWTFRNTFYPTPTIAFFNLSIWSHFVIWNVGNYQERTAAQEPREIKVFIEKGWIRDGITLLKSAGIENERIQRCMECMGTGVWFEECARREGVAVFSKRRL
jgi:hypothetical protein